MAAGHGSYHPFSAAKEQHGEMRSEACFHPNSSCHLSLGASLVAQLVKNRPAMRETWV